MDQLVGGKIESEDPTGTDIPVLADAHLHPGVVDISVTHTRAFTVLDYDIRVPRWRRFSDERA